jgi:hypothetical protein
MEFTGNQWKSMEINKIQWYAIYTVDTIAFPQDLSILGAHFETATTASPAGTLS